MGYHYAMIVQVAPQLPPAVASYVDSDLTNHPPAEHDLYPKYVHLKFHNMLALMASRRLLVE